MAKVGQKREVFLGPIRVDDETREALRRLAERHDRTMAAEVRSALRRYIDAEGGQT